MLSEFADTEILGGFPTKTIRLFTLEFMQFTDTCLDDGILVKVVLVIAEEG